ncbi:hypothetical protein GCM10027614_13330 [Micromonospora vulcania]
MGRVDATLEALLGQSGGLVTRRDVLRVAPAWTIQASRRAGRLVRLLPEVYVDAALVSERNPDFPALARVQPELARRAALAYGGGRGALSRLTALDGVYAGSGWRSRCTWTCRSRRVCAADRTSWYVTVRRSPPSHRRWLFGVRCR